MIVDLRSDTVTRPTPAMRAAMAAAEVGDDVFGDDPTVNRLQAVAAARLGKPAALFVPSGTMANLAAMLAWCARGDEVILGNLAHTFVHEAGGTAAVGGIHPHPLPNLPDGTLDLDQVVGAIRADDPHYPITRLICLENTHNRCGGVPFGPEYMAAARAVADAHGLKLHLDGARLFNAAVAVGVDARELAVGADSVSFCLSKGLGAPVGSLLCGPEDFIYRAWRARKMLGGGMRQAGVLAAAGLVALETMVDRLADDHANARRLAEGLAALPGVELDPAAVRTNIVVFALAEGAMTPRAFADALHARDVWLFTIGGRHLRAVTHHQVTAEGVERAIAAARAVLGG